METTLAVIVENLAPTNGATLTPVWVGFHNGQFDNYNRGEVIPAGFEALAEDGNTAEVSAQFASSGFGAVDGTLGGSPFGPTGIASGFFTVNSTDANARYFNYASMIVPSNDTWIANGNPLARQVFDDSGNFTPLDFIVAGSSAVDAGTEVNDEIPANTAFFGQQTPNTGTDENGVVTGATGLQPAGSGGILDDPRFANANYVDYDVARIVVTELNSGDGAANNLTGTDGVDMIIGLDGNDTLTGAGSLDVLAGNAGNDVINGGAGNDLLRGGQGNDVINGGIDSDIIWGDRGSDTLTGGAGSDSFVFRSGDGSDVITDFLPGVDDFTLSGGLTFSDLTITEQSGNAVVSVTSTAEVLATLTGVAASELSSTNFVIDFR